MYFRKAFRSSGANAAATIALAGLGTSAKRSAGGDSVVRMAKVFAGRDSVPDKLFELLDLRKPPFIRAGPDDLSAKAHFEYTPRTGYQSDFADLTLECGQEFLGHPGRPQKPTALGAVRDFNPRSVGRHSVQCNS